MQQVYTVTQDNKVHIANVTLGPQYGSDWIVNSGLPADARVIIDNLQKLREGAPVSPQAVAPATRQASTVPSRQGDNRCQNSSFAGLSSRS